MHRKEHRSQGTTCGQPRDVSGCVFKLEQTFEYRSGSNCCVLSIYPISVQSPRDHPYTSGARGQCQGLCYNIDTWQCVTLSVTETWPGEHCSLLCNIHNAYKHLRLIQRSKQQPQPWEGISTYVDVCTICLNLQICLLVFCLTRDDTWAVCWVTPCVPRTPYGHPAPGSPCRHHHQGRKNVSMIHHKIIINHFPQSAFYLRCDTQSNLHSALCHSLGNSQISSASISAHPCWPVDNWAPSLAELNLNNPFKQLKRSSLIPRESFLLALLCMVTYVLSPETHVWLTCALHASDTPCSGNTNTRLTHGAARVLIINIMTSWRNKTHGRRQQEKMAFPWHLYNPCLDVIIVREIRPSFF